MSESTTRTQKLVPQGLYADLARTALNCLKAQQQFFKTKLRTDLLVAKDWEKRLNRTAQAALDLVNTTPDMFATAEAAGPPQYEFHDPDDRR